MNGYISKEYTIWCGLCSKWDQESGNLNGLIKEWKLKGWKKTKKRGWVCKHCFGKFAESLDLENK